MTEELVKAVANVLTECRKRHRRDNDGRLAKEGLWPDPHSTPTDEDLARAVIPVVLEEAARVADAEAGRLREEADQIPGVSSRTEQRVAEFIACAIRNLGSI